eukprot:Selendium_serpulae@DN5349_c0_g1_i3.p1
MVSLVPVEGGVTRVVFSLPFENVDVDAIDTRIEGAISRARLDCSPLCSATDPNRATLESLFESFVKEPCYLNDTSGNAVGDVLALILQSKAGDILQLFARPRTTRCGFRVQTNTEQKLLMTYIALYRQPADDEMLLQCVAAHWMQIYSNCRQHPGTFTQYIFNMSAEVTPPSLRSTIFQRIVVDAQKELGGPLVTDIAEPPQQLLIDIAHLPLLVAIIMKMRLQRFIINQDTSGPGR